MKSISIAVLSIGLALLTIVAIIGALRFSKVADELFETQTRLTAAENSLIAQERALDQARKTRAVLEGHFDRLTEDAARWRQLASDLSTIEGANEDLNPYERAVLDSLRNN